MLEVPRAAMAQPASGCRIRSQKMTGSIEGSSSFITEGLSCLQELRLPLVHFGNKSHATSDEPHPYIASAWTRHGTGIYWNQRVLAYRAQRISQSTAGQQWQLGSCLGLCHERCISVFSLDPQSKSGRQMTPECCDRFTYREQKFKWSMSIWTLQS